jgi:CheY-like chemotaxis protein
MTMVDTNILLVDDDQDTCASMSDIISDLGYRVDVAHDGPAALELSRRKPYGLALLDFKLPGMNGVEVYGHLKQVRADTVGVLVTGFASDATIHAAVQAGIGQVVPKPVHVGHLIPLIEEVVGMAEPSSTRGTGKPCRAPGGHRWTRTNEGGAAATQLRTPRMSRQDGSSEGWFYKQNGTDVGPVSRLQLRKLVRRGQVQPRQAVWQQSTKDQFIVWAATLAFGSESKVWLWTS